MRARNASATAAAASVIYDIDQWLFENQMVPHPGNTDAIKIGPTIVNCLTWLSQGMSGKFERLQNQALHARYTQSIPKKVLTTDARKVWSTRAKESQEIREFSTGLQDCT